MSPWAGWTALWTPFQAPETSSPHTCGHDSRPFLHSLAHTDPPMNSLLFCYAFFKHYVIWSTLSDSMFSSIRICFKVSLDVSGCSWTAFHYRIPSHAVTAPQWSSPVHPRQPLPGPRTAQLTQPDVSIHTECGPLRHAISLYKARQCLPTDETPLHAPAKCGQELWLPHILMDTWRYQAWHFCQVRQVGPDLSFQLTFPPPLPRLGLTLCFRGHASLHLCEMPFCTWTNTFFVWPIFSHSSWHLFLFLVCHKAGGILVPWPGIKPAPCAMKVGCPNHWTTRKVPFMVSLK